MPTKSCQSARNSGEAEQARQARAGCAPDSQRPCAFARGLRTALGRIMIGNHTSLWVVGAFVLPLLVGCDRSRELVELPTRGRVYVEREVGSQKRLEPASGVLILAERINVCERSSWSPGEGSTTGIDAYLVRSDADGRYQIPGRRTDNVCSRVGFVCHRLCPGLFLTERPGCAAFTVHAQQGAVCRTG
jgi:hypothetical protein